MARDHHISGTTIEACTLKTNIWGYSWPKGNLPNLNYSQGLLSQGLLSQGHSLEHAHIGDQGPLIP